MGSTEDIEVDLASELGARPSPSFQVLTLYIPDRDRNGREIGNQRKWVLEAAELLSEIGGGVTVLPPAEGGWFDESTRQTVWDRPLMVYSYVEPEAFVGALPRLRALLHHMGRETCQGEVAVEFAGQFFRIREFDST
jgi:hypothetical protein